MSYLKRGGKKGEMPQTSTQIHTPVILTKPQVEANIQFHPEQVIIEDQPSPTPNAAGNSKPKKAIKSFRTSRITTQEALNAFTMDVKDDRQMRHANFTPQKFDIPHSMKDSLNIEQFCAPVIHPTTGENLQISDDPTKYRIKGHTEHRIWKIIWKFSARRQ